MSRTVQVLTLVSESSRVAILGGLPTTVGMTSLGAER
jgi:hypothetical protein